jgi:hypothetical protein
MASWMRKNDYASRHGRPDGFQIDRPEGAEAFDDEDHLKARIMFMLDLQAAGATTRAVASWFGLSKGGLHRMLADVPQFVKDNRKPEGRYLDRLRSVVESKPKTLPELIRLMQAKVGTLGRDEAVLFTAGTRRRSADTVLGAARTSRARSKGAGE